MPLPINEIGVVSYIVSRGYCHITINARGTGKSTGTRLFQFSSGEQKDLADTIEWVASQNWCDGNVGMVGMSYFAAMQYFAAAARPPHLKAIFPYLGFTNFYRHFAYHGGAFQSDFFSFYYSLVGSTQKLSVSPTVRHLLSYVLDRRAIQAFITRIFLPMRPRLTKSLHPEESWMRDFATLAFDQKYDSEFYREKSATLVLEEIDIPVCIGTNWGNPGLHMMGAFEAWHRIRSPQKKMFIGPAEPLWPWENYQDELLAWYDYYLKGIENGIGELPPVRYWLQGAKCWKSASDWPLPDARKKRLFLAPRSESNLVEHQLREEIPDSGSLSFVAIPRGMIYPKELEKYETQVLSYVTEPFEKDTEVTGPVRLHLALSSSAIDTHIIARITDLSPEGKTHKLSFGWLQASHRRVNLDLSTVTEIAHDHSSPEALIPFEAVVMDISLTPLANLFKVGHKLRLEIGSRPDILEGTYYEGFVYFPYDAPPYPARNAIYHGASEASFLEVKIRDE